MRDALTDRLLAEQDRRRGLAAEELLVFYQPLVDLRDTRLVGAEALVRWRRPNGEIMPPGSFISLAEETGLIRSIGDFVTQTACEQLARWDPRALAAQQTPNLHVNLPAR